MGLDDIVEEIKRIAQEKGFGAETQTGDGLRLSNGDKIIGISTDAGSVMLTLPSVGGLSFAPSLSIGSNGRVLGLDLQGSRGYKWLIGGARKQLERDFVREAHYKPKAVQDLLDAYIDASIQSEN